MILFYQKSGYSVIEIVVYVALIGSMFVVSTNTIISMYRTFGILRTERQVSLNGDVAMEMMIRDIRLATSTTIADSVFLSNPGSLRLNAKKFSLNGTTLRRDDNINPAQDINGSDVRVTSLVFYRDISPTSEIISVRMTIESGQGGFIKSKEYYGSAVLRGGYK